MTAESTESKGKALNALLEANRKEFKYLIFYFLIPCSLLHGSMLLKVIVPSVSRYPDLLVVFNTTTEDAFTHKWVLSLKYTRHFM